MIHLDHAAILAFFSGKNREAAAAALVDVTAALALGEWIPGVSRKSRAALNKPNAAQTFVRKFLRKTYGADMLSYKHHLYDTVSTIRYGNFERLAPVVGCAVDDKNVALVDYYFAFHTAFVPVAAAFKFLDAQRPKPKFIVGKELSPTQKKTLAGFDNATAVDVCPMEFVRQPDGTCRVFLKWPEGTRFCASRFSHSDQCQACGHGIRVRDNWVPLVLTTAAGPRALWVGSDCARSLFGIGVKGDLAIAEHTGRSNVNP